MSLDEPTTIAGWMRTHPGAMNLRLTRPNPRRAARDLRAAEGIVLATVTGAAIIAWTVAFIRWFL